MIPCCAHGTPLETTCLLCMAKLRGNQRKPPDVDPLREAIEVALAKIDRARFSLIPEYRCKLYDEASDVLTAALKAAR